MQSDSVQWDLTSINHAVPWDLRVLNFYFLLVLIFLLVRSIQLTWFFLRHRRSTGNHQVGQVPRTARASGNEFALASARGNSLKRAAILTFLFSITILAEGLAKVTRFVVANKMVYPAALAGSCAEVLISFSVGAGICTVLYAAFWLFEGRLRQVASRLETTS